MIWVAGLGIYTLVDLDVCESLVHQTTIAAHVACTQIEQCIYYLYRVYLIITITSY